MADFIDRVTLHFDELTKSHKEVATYFLYNLDKVAVSTLEELAGITGVSTTTVIRFARQLGYSGFTQLQKDAQEIVLNKESMTLQETPAYEAENVDSLLSESIKRDWRNVENTMKGLSRSVIDETAALLCSDSALYLLGMRMAFSLAYYSYASWGRTRRDIHLIQTTGMEYPEEMVGMKKGDVCVVFAFPRYTSVIVRLLKWMKSRGVRIILFTSSNFVAAREYVEVMIPCRVKTSSYQNSYAAPICLINYFTRVLASKNYEEAVELLKDTEELLGPGFYISN